MKPIFTIHAGEYLVGEEIERRLPAWELWLPSKDTGVDLLLRHKETFKTKSIQVKFSRSFTETHTQSKLKSEFRTQGWWSLNKKKLEKSPADYWVFALYSFDTIKNDFLIFTKDELIQLYKNLGVFDKTRIHTYLWTLKNGEAYEGRGIKKREQEELVKGAYIGSIRDVSIHLNNWKKFED